MPSEYWMDSAQHLVRSRAWGTLTMADSMAHYGRIARDGRFDPTFRQLCDLRGVEVFDLSRAELREMAKHSIFSPGTRRAFVAHEDEHFGLARMFETFCELEGCVVGVFRTIEEAERWLDVVPSPAIASGNPDAQAS